MTSLLWIYYTYQNVSLSSDRLFHFLAAFKVKLGLTLKKTLFPSNMKIRGLEVEYDVAPRCPPLFSNTLSHFMFPVCAVSDLFDAD